jgi:hypothetical protein
VLSLKEPFDFGDKPFHVDQGVTGKDLWKPIGQITNKALSWPFVQMKFECELMVAITAIMEADIIGPICGVPVKRVKKPVRERFRNQSF